MCIGLWPTASPSGSSRAPAPSACSRLSSALGGYSGRKRDRRATSNWRPKQTSVNEKPSADLPNLRSRSRNLARNVPIATGAINTVVTSVIGDGLMLQSQIDTEDLGLTAEQAEAWKRQAEREFAIWARRPDFASKLNFDEMQALILRPVLESGDVLVDRRPRNILNPKLLRNESKSRDN